MRTRRDTFWEQSFEGGFRHWTLSVNVLTLLCWLTRVSLAIVNPPTIHGTDLKSNTPGWQVKPEENYDRCMSIYIPRILASFGIRSALSKSWFSSVSQTQVDYGEQHSSHNICSILLPPQYLYIHIQAPSKRIKWSFSPINIHRLAFSSIRMVLTPFKPPINRLLR